MDADSYTKVDAIIDADDDSNKRFDLGIIL